MKMNTIIGQINKVEARINHEFKNTMKKAQASHIIVDNNTEEAFINGAFFKILATASSKKMDINGNKWKIDNYVGRLALEREKLSIRQYKDMKANVHIVKNYHNSAFTIIIGGCPFSLFWDAPERIELSEESLINGLNELEAEVKTKIHKEVERLLNPPESCQRAHASETIRELSFYLDVIKELKWEIDSARWAA